MRSRRTSARTRGRGLGRVPYLIAAGAVLWLSLVGAGLFWGGGSDDASGDGRPPEAGEASGSAAAGDSREHGQGEADRDAGGSGEAPRAETGPEARPGDEGYSEVDRGGGGEGREPSGTRLPRGTSGGGAPPYDPLGTGADAGEHSETDLSRARLAAFRFVDAAYDFEGSGPSARLRYLEDVGRTVDAPEFWKSPDSPGSEPAEAVAARIAEYGVENAALFGDFRVEETSSERVTGTVTFALDEGSGEKTYEQRLVLARWAAVWRVLYARPLEEVS